MKKYLRASLEVVARQYEIGKDMEDGFQNLSKIVTNGWINTENLVKIEQSDGQIICPFLSNKRGLVFINEGDYIIFEGDEERHVCSGTKFSTRFVPVS
ncbi:MAG: hypothetical protein LBC96_07440 [Lachnospiraceae bacterium]|jgi:hypothetical protein|nr:hypothetical protein [Lachnospiraceae bacterium]